MSMSTDEYTRIFHNIDKSWKNILISKNKVSLIKAMNSIAPYTATLCPKLDNIFNAFRLTPLDLCKVVIIGMEPINTYEIDSVSGFNSPVADGLAFSSRSAIVSPVLQNIYSCLLTHKHVTDIPTTSDLQWWATQGVLMLNLSLTTVKGFAKSHTAIWDEYIKNVIKDLCAVKEEQNKNLIFMLWGKDAQKLESIIGQDHFMWRWAHPSPMAQGALPLNKKFQYCIHFDDANKILDDAIDWDPSTKVRIFTDGSSTVKKEPNVGGWAMYVTNGPDDDLVHYSKISTVIVDGKSHGPTNQRGEGLAIIAALNYILVNNIMYPIEIVTDSQFYIDVLTNWMHTWHIIDPTFHKNKSGNPVKNRDIIIQLYELYNKVTSKIKLTFKHVNSHRDAPVDISSDEYNLWWGNFMADKYAGEGKDQITFDTVICNSGDC